MEANELRIGNLVKFGDNICKVIEINTVAFYVRNLKTLEEVKDTWADLQPIPLTEEWLLKCGFEKQGDCLFIELVNGSIYYNDELQNGISVCIGEYCSRGACFENIKYLHSLQNIFHSLTNEELTINL